MIATQPVDPDRIYFAGHSNGAMMSYRYACERPGVVAAIVAVSGPLMIDRCDASGLKVLHIHGQLDNHVPVTGGRGRESMTRDVNFRSVQDTEKRMKQAGASFQLMLVPGTDHNMGTIDQNLASNRSGTLAEMIGQFLNGKSRSTSPSP